MSKYFLAGFLIVFGISLLVAIGIPTWVSGLLSVAAGILILIDR